MMFGWWVTLETLSKAFDALAKKKCGNTASSSSVVQTRFVSFSLTERKREEQSELSLNFF
jgi:hypothetical protein